MALESSDPSLIDELKAAVVHGKTVLLFVDDASKFAADKVSDEDRTFLSRLLQRQFKLSNEEDRVLLSQSGNSVNSKLHIYMVIRRTLKSTISSDGTIRLSPFLSKLGIHVALDGSIIDIELKKIALENNMQKFVIIHKRPEYRITHKSLLTDLSLHEQMLEASQRTMLEYTLNSESKSLLRAEDLLDTISRSEASEVAAHEQIREAKMNLRVSEQQVFPYKPLSSYASVLLSTIQRVASVIRYFNLSVDRFETMLSKVIYEFKDMKVPDHSMSIKAHVIHFKNHLLLSVYQKLQVSGHEIYINCFIAIKLFLTRSMFLRGTNF